MNVSTGVIKSKENTRVFRRGMNPTTRGGYPQVIACLTAYQKVSTSAETWSWSGVSVRNKTQPCVGCTTQPIRLSRVNSTTCEVHADIHPHHTSHEVRRTSHNPAYHSQVGISLPAAQDRPAVPRTEFHDSRLKSWGDVKGELPPRLSDNTNRQ
jgi:hypothetical protein